MIKVRPTRNSPENYFQYHKNVSGVTASAGSAMVFDISVNYDGMSLTKPATASLDSFAGVVENDILNDAFGLILVRGSISALVLSTSGTQTAGQRLTIVNNDFAFVPVTATGVDRPLGFLAEDISTTPGNTVLATVFIF